MIDSELCRHNAADCLQLAQSDETPEGRNIFLNIALAWLRLSRQVQRQAESPDEILSPGIVPEEVPALTPLEQPADETRSTQSADRKVRPILHLHVV